MSMAEGSRDWVEPPGLPPAMKRLGRTDRAMAIFGVCGEKESVLTAEVNSCNILNLVSCVDKNSRYFYVRFVVINLFYYYSLFFHSILMIIPI